MRKIIINLGSKKCENNNTCTFQLACINNSLLLSIVDTPEKDLSNVDQKSYMRIVRIYSLKSSSKFYSCSIFANVQ